MQFKRHTSVVAHIIRVTNCITRPSSRQSFADAWQIAGQDQNDMLAHHLYLLCNLCQYLMEISPEEDNLVQTFLLLHMHLSMLCVSVFSEQWTQAQEVYFHMIKGHCRIRDQSVVNLILRHYRSLIGMILVLLVCANKCASREDT